jgi:hypothetical protein
VKVKWPKSIMKKSKGKSTENRPLVEQSQKAIPMED